MDEPPPDTPDASIRVLLVEDHRMVAEGLADALRSEDDLEVVGVARTCRAAVELAQATAPDVVLMDYHLPDGNGADAAARIREVAGPPGVIMVTAATGDDVLAAAVAAGCAGFIGKAQPVREVLAAVRAVHAGRVLLPPAALARLAAATQARSGGVGSRLTERELEVVRLLAEGRSTQEIAERLVLSRHTVRNHIQGAISKLGAHSKLEAVAVAAKRGLIHLEAS